MIVEEDIIAEDRDGNPILIVEVKVADASQADILAFLNRFVKAVPTLEFAAHGPRMVIAGAARRSNSL